MRLKIKKKKTLNVHVTKTIATMSIKDNGQKARGKKKINVLFIGIFNIPLLEKIGKKEKLENTM